MKLEESKLPWVVERRKNIRKLEKGGIGVVKFCKQEKVLKKEDEEEKGKRAICSVGNIYICDCDAVAVFPSLSTVLWD